MAVMQILEVVETLASELGKRINVVIKLVT
jgi:hypothetical protein